MTHIKFECGASADVSPLCVGVVIEDHLHFCDQCPPEVTAQDDWADWDARVDAALEGLS